jgi:PAS domain S-box-containing protein
MDKEESEAHIQSIFKALPLGIHQYELDASENLIFTGANPAADAILHIEHDKLIGFEILKAFPSLSGTDIPDIYRRMAKGGEAVHKEQVAYEDERIVGAFEVNAFNTGKRKMAAVFSDILERKKAEIDRDRFFEISEDIILQGNLDGHYTDINAAATRILGWSREEFLLNPWKHFIHPDDLAPSLEAMKELALGNRVVKVENRHRHKDGSYRWLSWSSMYVREEKKVISIVRDVTEEKSQIEKRRQMEKLEAIGRLAGGVAHDFNNQLTGIMGCAEIIKAKLSADSELQEYVSLIICSAKNSADLAGQLLAFARKGKFQTHSIDINAVIRDAASLLSHTIDKKIALELDLAESPVFLEGDPSQLQNVIMNLGLNARDAMPNGGAIVFHTEMVDLDRQFLDAHEHSGNPGRFAKISIIDNGIGMDDSVWSHLFEPFFTTKPEGHGTGLGLAAVYGIIKSHHGMVDVSSQQGQGTSFTLYFPLSESTAQAGREKDKPMETKPEDAMQIESAWKPSAETAILIVDDEEVICQMAKAMLGLAGYATAIAQTGSAAEKYLKSHPCPDLILLDMIMPDMHGEEVFNVIMDIYPQARVLISSGYSIDGAAQTLLDKGAKGFIQKPYRKDALYKAVENALEG